MSRADHTGIFTCKGTEDAMFRQIIPVLAFTLISVGCQRPWLEPLQENRAALETQMTEETSLVSPPVMAKLDASLPGYRPLAEALQGTLEVVGSDSMDPMVQLWADNFRSIYPRMEFRITSRGSGTAPKALLAGTAHLGPMSREMSPSELAQFEAKFGYAPTRIVVAVDALAVYVNVNNPIQSLTLQQVDAIFSSTRKGGYPSVETWDDLGVTGEWAARTIQPYGRDQNSGTRAFFREHALLKGDYKHTVKTLPDQFATVEATAMDGSGISYGPVQHSVRMVKALPLVDFGGSKPMLPTVENILGGRYPLNRFLYIYINKTPGKPLPPAIQEFLTYILSREGQAAVANFGAIPLPWDMARMSTSKF